MGWILGVHVLALRAHTAKQGCPLCCALGIRRRVLAEDERLEHALLKRTARLVLLDFAELAQVRARLTARSSAASPSGVARVLFQQRGQKCPVLPSTITLPPAMLGSPQV